MSKISKDTVAPASAVARVKKKNMLKRQRIAAVLVGIGVLLLALALCVVLYFADIYSFEDINGDKYTVKKHNGSYALFHASGEICDTTEFDNKMCYLTRLGTVVMIDGESGESEIKVVVDTEGSENQDYGTTVMMFKGMTYDEDAVKDKSMIIRSIEVTNSEGGYSFVRDKNDEFYISGAESAPYSRNSFAMLANACGRSRATRRLESPVLLSSGEIDYSEYGLASEIRTRIEADENGNEFEVEYEYTPVSFVITAMNGDRHKVTVGDMTVTGTAFYAKYEGGEVYDADGNVMASPQRDTVYVLSITNDMIYGSASGYELLCGRIEGFVTPTIVYPMNSSDYFYVSNFVIRDDIDYLRINQKLAEDFGEEDIGSEEFLKRYAELFDEYSKKVCDFSFYDMDERAGTLDAYTPYVSNLEYASGYYLNGTNVDIMLSGFYGTEFGEVVSLSPSQEELEKYGLFEAPNVISFLYRTENDKGETVYVDNFVDISEKTEDGYYYAYSKYYDMIVTVSGKSFDFLEWDEKDWYSDSYIQYSISNVDSILIESPAFSTEFRIEDSVSKYLSYTAQSGKNFSIDEKKFEIVENDSGKHVLMHDGHEVDAYYSGDYLITPVVCKYGEREAENYLFSESSEVDVNGDGTNDGVIYYFYDIIKNDGIFQLAAQVVMTDLSGNPISDTKTVFGEVAYESSYYLTRTGYLFFANRNSSVGKNIDVMFGDKRGSWGRGCMFITSNGKNIFIDSDTAAWMIVDDVKCGLYLANSENSRLAQRAVEIPVIYDESGKLKRYSDIYYPLTDKKIKYDEENDIIAAYDNISGEWKKITYSDCTIGVWGKGDYYVLEGGICMLVDEATGDIGKVDVLSTPTFVADVMADGKLLNYTVSRDGFTASSKIATAMQNFQELYKYLLTASFEDQAELDDEQKEEFRKKDDFTSGDEESCALKITLKVSDLKGNEREFVYRFYRYSERRAYLTIETVGEDGPSSEKAYGNFSVLYSFVRKVIEDAEKVVNEQAVYSSEKY